MKLEKKKKTVKMNFNKGSDGISYFKTYKIYFSRTSVGEFEFHQR